MLTNKHVHYSSQRRTRHNEGWAEGQLLVLREEVVGVLVQNHPADRLQGEQVLGPDLGDIQRIERELVLIAWVHGLDEQLPLWVLAGGNGVVQVLRGVAVVASTHHDSLILQQVLHA